MIEDKIDELVDEQKRHHDKIEAQNRLKNILLFLILLAIIFHMIFCCPHASVKGYGLDKHVEDQNGNPLANATVTIYSNPHGSIIAQKHTDEYGWANFTGLSYGLYWLYVEYGDIHHGEWVWVCHDTQLTNTLTIPTQDAWGWQ